VRAITGVFSLDASIALRTLANTIAKPSDRAPPSASLAGRPAGSDVRRADRVRADRVRRDILSDVFGSDPAFHSTSGMEVPIPRTSPRTTIMADWHDCQVPP
jgi:hypothetical protein